jgi:hypothetical protein
MLWDDWETSFDLEIDSSLAMTHTNAAFPLKRTSNSKDFNGEKILTIFLLILLDLDGQRFDFEISPQRKGTMESLTFWLSLKIATDVAMRKFSSNHLRET